MVPGMPYTAPHNVDRVGLPLPSGQRKVAAGSILRTYGVTPQIPVTDGVFSRSVIDEQARAANRNAAFAAASPIGITRPVTTDAPARTPLTLTTPPTDADLKNYEGAYGQGAPAGRQALAARTAYVAQQRDKANRLTGDRYRNQELEDRDQKRADIINDAASYDLTQRGVLSGAKADETWGRIPLYSAQVRNIDANTKRLQQLPLTPVPTPAEQAKIDLMKSQAEKNKDPMQHPDVKAKLVAADRQRTEMERETASLRKQLDALARDRDKLRAHLRTYGITAP